MKVFFFLCLFLISCTHTNYKTSTLDSIELSATKKLKPGKHIILQNATSDTETTITVFSPRLKNYSYQVFDQNENKIETAQKYETISYAPSLWKIDKIHITQLQPSLTYKIKVVDLSRSSETIADERTFSTIDLNKKSFSYALLSCMADDWRFIDVIPRIWQNLANQKPDLVIMAGDSVYVDSFEFVEREKATELDLWLRYVDAFQKIPYYRSLHLTPTLALWDDHDYGTNDGDRLFIGKEPAKKIFNGVFGSKNITEIFEYGPQGTYAFFKTYNHVFYLMDNRFYRQPNKDQKQQELYGHWGETQHQWLLNQLNKHQMPATIVNGNQIFNGKGLSFKEALGANHPAHYTKLMEDLKKLSQPVVFASGDIHFSEVVKVPADRGPGYETYELTSSAMHSYTRAPWENPFRVPGAMTGQFNFLLIQVDSTSKNSLLLDIQSVGAEKSKLFELSVSVQR
jgi:alkaline phosphatase D